MTVLKLEMECFTVRGGKKQPSHMYFIYFICYMCAVIIWK